MCGIIGLRFENQNDELGSLAGKLLQMLEYRGYDSTGALFQDVAGQTVLLKDVGAPSLLVKKLGIDCQKGNLFCGQVRWATFGAVNQENSQPHEVKCRVPFFGAHNGNITNYIQVRDWLLSEGHCLKSENDGEVLVHVVEHFFSLALEKGDGSSPEGRRKALGVSVVQAHKKLRGSFAAVVFDPQSGLMAAIKSGSSLYVGVGYDEKGGAYVMVSSDLGSVLSQTKILLPLSDSEYVVSGFDEPEVFSLHTGGPRSRRLTRTRLNMRDTKLHAPFRFFMEQEIASQAKTGQDLVILYTGKSPLLDLIRKVRAKDPKLISSLKDRVVKALALTDPKMITDISRDLLESEEVKRLLALAEGEFQGSNRWEPISSMSGFLDEVHKFSNEKPSVRALLLLDAIFTLSDTEELEVRIKELSGKMVETLRQGRHIYFVACGTSFHAAKTGTLFFNEIAGVPYFPLLPGEFRTQYSLSINDGDMIVGISQSGETKDLIDIFNQVEESGKDVALAVIVNNVNSTLAQEKSSLCIPLFCGPEIAVPATKSFINQLMLLYFLALRLMDCLQAQGMRGPNREKRKRYWNNFFSLPALIEKTKGLVGEAVERVALELHLEPSIHILATGMVGIAQEGALKIREVVLNHTQGFEGSEFKHGPNTILGVNTVFGMGSLRAILGKFSDAFIDVLKSPEATALSAEDMQQLFKAILDYGFYDLSPKDVDARGERILKIIFEKHNFFESMYRNYPLVFISGPSERDVHLSISQINTHKIRGANIFLVAEPSDELRQAVKRAPDIGHPYKFDFIELPVTGDMLMSVFSSTVVLQLLAFRMSVHKAELLNRLDITGHGVHPDAPKNVSKSITVD